LGGNHICLRIEHVESRSLTDLAFLNDARQRELRGTDHLRVGFDGLDRGLMLRPSCDDRGAHLVARDVDLNPRPAKRLLRLANVGGCETTLTAGTATRTPTVAELKEPSGFSRESGDLS
jgi:hypothetical protein